MSALPRKRRVVALIVHGGYVNEQRRWWQAFMPTVCGNPVEWADFYKTARGADCAAAAARHPLCKFCLERGIMTAANVVDHVNTAPGAIGPRSSPASSARASPRGVKLGNPKQAEINRAKAAEQAQALRPHIEGCIHVEQCDRSRSQRARHRGRMAPMVSDASSSPLIVSADDRGRRVDFAGVARSRPGQAISFYRTIRRKRYGINFARLRHHDGGSPSSNTK